MRRVRVRRNFVRGELGTPKSKRSSRSVRLADRLAGELNLLHQETLWRGDEGFVFAHPHIAKPIDRSKLLKRFKAALRAAGVREVRFHDLRHTFGTRMAARDPIRALQEMMGHRDFETTLIYADYMPSARGRVGRGGVRAPAALESLTPPLPAVRDDGAVAGGRRIHPGAEQRALERGLALGELAELVLTHHDRRLRNPGEADWVIHAGGVAIVYDWPDGNDPTTALVISVWRE